jgi:DNA repair exonuclease SbcCD ATPase subunit
MKHVVLIAVLAGAAAGAGGAMVTTVLTMPVQPQEKGASTALASDGTSEIREQLASLREENRQLWDRVKYLEENGGTAAPTRLPAHAGPSPDLASLERKIEELESALGGDVGTIDPASYATFNAFMEQREAEEQREREQQREERALERIDQRVTQLTETLGLDATQARQMRDVLRDESSRRDAMMQAIRESGEWSDAREQMRSLRDEINETVSSFLTPAQYEKYQESGGNDFGRGRGGFFRGADGGGPGGGGRGGRGGGGD